MRRYITTLMLACCIGGYGQEKKQATFVPPFDFPLTLSGNFGEIRSNHFHGGLDFKTGGQQYDYCINKLGCGAVLDYIGVPYRNQQLEVDHC